MRSKRRGVDLTLLLTASMVLAFAEQLGARNSATHSELVKDPSTNSLVPGEIRYYRPCSQVAEPSLWITLAALALVYAWSSPSTCGSRACMRPRGHPVCSRR